MDNDNQPKQPGTDNQETDGTKPTNQETGAENQSTASAPLADSPETDEAPAGGGAAGGGRKKIIGIAVAVILVALVIAGGAIAYVYMNNPQRALARAVEQLSEQDAVATNFTFQDEVDGELETYKGDLSFKSDSENPKKIELKVGVRQNDTRLGLTLRSVDKTYYFRLAGLDKLGAFLNDPQQQQQLQNPFVQTYLNGFNATWFKISHEQANEFLEQSNDEINPDDFTKKDIEKIAEVYRENPFFIIEDKGGAEVAGEATRHLSLTIDHKKYIAFLQALQEANIDGLEITDEQIQEARDNKEEITKGRLEVWLANDDGNFKRIKLLPEAEKEYLQVTFKPVENENVTVAAPENAEDIGQVLENILGSSARPAGQPAVPSGQLQ